MVEPGPRHLDVPLAHPGPNQISTRRLLTGHERSPSGAACKGPIGYPGRMRGARVCACVVLLAGCGDDAASADDRGGSSTTGEPAPLFDYAECPPAMQDATCEGSGCGRTQEAQDYLAIMLEVVAEAGHATAFTPTLAEYTPLVDELAIDYQLQVGWFRAATTVHFDVPDAEEFLREEMAAHISGWQIPDAMATPAALTAAVEACQNALAYDPCVDNTIEFLVHDRYGAPQAECMNGSSSVVIDARDASTLACEVEPPPCG
jgi:hypothetical protein